MVEQGDTDAERIAIGQDPLQGEYLDDRGDLEEALQRLGRDTDSIPTTRWEQIYWSCPLDDCDGHLAPVDTSSRTLPSDLDELDDTVDLDDDELFLGLTNAQIPTVPVVLCGTCKNVFEANFRRLRDPDEWNLPEPTIVKTPDTLSGAPRIDGTRISVTNVLSFAEQGYTAEEIATEFSHLTEGHVQAALDWAETHPDEIAALEERHEEHHQRVSLLTTLFESALDGILDDLWNIMVHNRSRQESQLALPYASRLRNNIERASNVSIDIDTDARRVSFTLDPEDDR